MKDRWYNRALVVVCSGGWFLGLCIMIAAFFGFCKVDWGSLIAAFCVFSLCVVGFIMYGLEKE